MYSGSRITALDHVTNLVTAGIYGGFIQVKYRISSCLLYTQRSSTLPASFRQTTKVTSLSLPHLLLFRLLHPHLLLLPPFHLQLLTLLPLPLLLLPSLLFSSPLAREERLTSSGLASATAKRSNVVKCTEKPRGCPARVTLHGSSPCCPPPLHNHEAQPSHIAVHLAKKNLKRKAADTDLPSKHLAAACQAELDFEAKSLLGCQENALVKMARLSRQKANHHPVNPASLETLVIPPSFVLFFLLR